MPLQPPAEQRAIAAVPADFDAELEALEAERAKWRLVMQGATQQLLTGRTRLVWYRRNLPRRLS